MNDRPGFFDVDCRELDTAGTGLGFRPRVEPLAATLNRLYAFIHERGTPLLFTTCCSGRPLVPGAPPDVLFVPRAAESREWLAHVGEHRRFYLEKRHCGNPQANYCEQAFDVFRHNANVVSLLKRLNVPRWVVFGNGFDFCVHSTARGLLRHGFQVHLLTDVMIAAARGYGEYGESGTEANRRRILDELAAQGATLGTLQELLESA